jgi:hypothetical protein
MVNEDKSASVAYGLVYLMQNNFMERVIQDSERNKIEILDSPAEK